MSNSWQIKSWTLLNVMRAIPDRYCSDPKSEDRVYGIIGLIGVRKINIEYNIGLTKAVVKLARAIGEDIMLLLTMV